MPAEVGLDHLSGRRVDKLSGGQQQRLQLAMALVVDPVLLGLDEPTLGLDIDARRSFWRTIAERRDQGVAVLLTTHQVEEAAAVADRVVVMVVVVVLSHGQVIASGHPADLTARLPDRMIRARTGPRGDALRDLPGVIDITYGVSPVQPPWTACPTREREVLRLVAAELSNTEIADDPVVSAATVKTHVSHLLQKLSARDRAQLVVIAYRAGVVSPAADHCTASPLRVTLRFKPESDDTAARASYRDAVNRPRSRNGDSIATHPLSHLTSRRASITTRRGWDDVTVEQLSTGHAWRYISYRAPSQRQSSTSWPPWWSRLAIRRSQQVLSASSGECSCTSVSTARSGSC